MNFLEKLDFLMERYGLNKSTLSQKSEIPYTTIDGWYKKGYEGLKITTLKKLCDYFNTTFDYWILDEINDPNYGKSSGFKVDYSEMEHIKKYRLLDDFGKETIQITMDRELKRSEMINSKEKRIAELEATPIVVEKENDSVVRIYTYLHKIACAGNGFYFDDIPTDSIEAPYREGADFIIGVNGDSMEPTFKDGDLVYVQKRQIVETGEIGVFFYNNECFIKEAGEDGLISHNADYKMIPGTERIQCIGKVLGKVENN